jgi:eukaryotic-like serine/threonine-protein kinase
VAVRDSLIGTVFDGRYKIVRKLGAGGMANVYLAEDQELGRHVAIKILNDKHANDDQFVERFRREAKNAASLSHPSIVSIYDRGDSEGTYYIAMEFLDGRTLKELIVSQGPTPVKIAIDYSLQILAAIGFAHRGEIVHRDIKPHNVVVDAEGRLKVTDFGIARSGASQMTEVGSIIGTAQYLSPEQARGAAVDPRSDLYSVGIVLYEMLTGQVPFTGDTPLEIAMKHLSAIPAPPSELRPDIPHDLDLVVLRALAKDPEDRYQSAEEMAADLARVASGTGVTDETADAATAVLAGAGIASAATAVVRPPPRSVARPPGAAPPAGYYGYEGPPRRRRPLWPWLLALLLLVGAGFAGWYAYTKIQDQLNANAPVSVPNVEGLLEANAKTILGKQHWRVIVNRESNPTVPKGFVVTQVPVGGTRLDKHNPVMINVSTGKPRVNVPGVVGKTSTDAVSMITAAGLTAKTQQIFSDKPSDTVVAQQPSKGRNVLKGSTVYINISKGLQQISVPDVRTQPIAVARGMLLGAGFVVTRQDAFSDQPVGTVVSQNPAPGALASKGSTVMLTVSKGPKQVPNVPVPDTTTQNQDTATALLKNSGFKVTVKKQQVTDPGQVGLVISQTPAGGTSAPKGSVVTIFVGQLVGTTTGP